MLRAFADGADRRVVRSPQIVADDDASSHGEAGFPREGDVRPDAGGNDDNVAIERCAIAEGEAGDVTVPAEPCRLVLEPDAHAELFHRALQHEAGGLIELDLHQVAHEMDDVHRDAVSDESTRGFEAEQTAANDHRPRRVMDAFEYPLAVLEGAEHEHAVLPPASGTSPFVGIAVQILERRHEWHAAHGQHQRVVRLDASVGSVHVLFARSIAVTFMPACRVTPCSAYQSSGLMKMSVGFCAPARTPESRMRL